MLNCDIASLNVKLLLVASVPLLSVIKGIRVSEKLDPNNLMSPVALLIVRCPLCVVSVLSSIVSPNLNKPVSRAISTLLELLMLVEIFCPPTMLMLSALTLELSSAVTLMPVIYPASLLKLLISSVSSA